MFCIIEYSAYLLLLLEQFIRLDLDFPALACSQFEDRLAVDLDVVEGIGQNVRLEDKVSSLGLDDLLVALLLLVQFLEVFSLLLLGQQGLIQLFDLFLGLADHLLLRSNVSLDALPLELGLNSR